MFIVLEGIDGCGKSTQAKLLYDWLLSTGKKAELTAEPTKNKIGILIREILSGSEKVDPTALALLFTADRYEHLGNFIEPNLREGKIVICERYYHSTIAYQSAQGVNKDWLLQINSFARKPDFTIFIDVKPEIAIINIKKKIDREKQSIEKMMSELKNARERHSREASKYSMRMYDSYIKKDPAAIARQPLEVSAQHVSKQMNEIAKEIKIIEDELNRGRMDYMKFEKFENLVGFGNEGYEIFLAKVYDNYKKFTDMTSVDGNRPIDNVLEDIKVVVSKSISI